MQHRHRIVINMRSVLILIMVFIASAVKHNETASSNETNEITDTKIFGEHQKDANDRSANNIPVVISVPDKLTTAVNNNNATTSNVCSNDKNMSCSMLNFPCIRCVYNFSCHYGRDLNVTCEALGNVPCQGERTFQRQMNCRYCYQTPLWQQRCVQRANCNSANDKPYRTNCTVYQDVLCLGNRSFTRNLRCNWTQGYRWSTAFIISLTLGGFGADRFYLGHWQEGIGKLFSFGGLGVWTIIDVLLISLHYLGPADGSLYV